MKSPAVCSNSKPKELTAFQGKLYFTAGADRQLWMSDGTAAGDRVFFPSFDPATGTELWAVRP